MNPSLLKIVLFGIVILVLSPIPFTNCAKNPQSAAVPVTAFLSETEKEQVLVQQFKGRVASSFCDLESSYACMKRVYSRNVASEIRAPANVCADNSGFCVATQVVHFNSADAEDTCENCGDNFETENYQCHLKLSNSDGIYPITAIADDLGSALSQLQKFCQNVAR